MGLVSLFNNFSGKVRSIPNRVKSIPGRFKGSITKFAGPSSAGNRQGSGMLESIPEFGGSRTTVPSFTQGGGGAFGALPKKIQADLSLDERRFSSMSVDDMIDTLVDAHPDMSFAVWNFVRIGNSGYTITVKKIGSDGSKPFTQGDKVLQEFLDRLEMPNLENFERSRSLNKLINQLLFSTVTRGAAAIEMIMTPGLDDCYFIAPVDPATIDFKFENDRFVPYQDQERISLDIPTFFYEGLDERIDDPYGRSPLLSAINMVLFQLQILNDIKAVVHNQGYPRFDIKIIEEVLLNRMPIQIRNNEEKKQEWLNDKLQEIIDMYNELEPDDTFVHYDSVEVGMVGGKGGTGGATIDPEKLMNAIDNLIMSGLKTLSTILGRRSTGNTESFAKLEIKLYLQGVAAIQDVVASLLSKALTFYLNVRGKQGIVQFKFNSVEIRTELEQAQFEQIALMNYAYMRDQGWIDQDEAAMRAVGHPAVGQPVLVPTTSTTGQIGGGTPKGTKDEKGPDSSSEAD